MTITPMVPMSTVPDFNSIDWVSLARMKGIRVSNEPIILSIMNKSEREALGEYYANILADDNEKVLDFVRDELDNLIIQGKMTTLDKAWVVLLTVRDLRKRGIVLH